MRRPRWSSFIIGLLAASIACGDRADLNYLKTLNDVPHLWEEDSFMPRLCNSQLCVVVCVHV